MGRLPRRARILGCSILVLATVAATKAQLQVLSPDYCQFCVSQCGDYLQVHCLGNANCPWPAGTVTCAPNLDCPPGQASVECSKEVHQ